MCKYYENPKVKKQLMKAGLWEHGVFFPTCKDDIPTEDERFDFCPKCGTPLGEVKPLTRCCKNCAGTIEKNKRGNPVCDIYKQCGAPDFYCAHFREPKGEAE